MAQWRTARRDHEDGVRFSLTGFIVLLLLSVALIAFDRPVSRSEAFSNFRASFNDAATPVLELAAWPLRGVSNVGPWWRRQIELAEENRALRADIAELQAWRDVALTLRDRSQLYEDALNLNTPAVRNRISAWAVAERAGPFVRSRLLGVGREDGVEVGYPAINIYGLVGRTVDVGRHSCRVLLLTDLNSRVAVMADRSNARALLTGDNTDFPRLEYLGGNPDIIEGDRIVTSGDDNVLPRGLPVGVAVLDRFGNWRVALYSDAAPVDLVWIWPFDPVEAPDAALEVLEAPATGDELVASADPAADASMPAETVPAAGDAAGGGG